MWSQGGTHKSTKYASHTDPTRATNQAQEMYKVLTVVCQTAEHDSKAAADGKIAAQSKCIPGFLLNNRMPGISIWTVLDKCTVTVSNTV